MFINNALNYRVTAPRPVSVPPSVKVAATDRVTVPLGRYQLLRFGSLDAHKAAELRTFATQWQPRKLDGYTIHNEFFTPFKTMDAAALTELLADLENKGSFDFRTNPVTGLVQTSETDNAHMLRQWFTDSCMVGHFQRKKHPGMWRKNMLTNAAALNSPDAIKAVEKTVADPAWYREGGLMNGVFHIYLPRSVAMDTDGLPKPEAIELDKTWFNQKRLASQALMLNHLVDTILAGPIAHQGDDAAPWGFTEKDLQGRGKELVTTAIGNMARYLIAVNTDPKTGKPNFKTPSASSWEEAPFKEGMTWDAAIMVASLEKLQQLLELSPSNKKLATLQSKINAAAPTVTPDQLKRYIQAGRQYVASRITAPLKAGKAPVQTPNRPYDTSLMLLAASDYRFDPEDTLSDARTRFKLIKQTKQALLGENGLRRYNEYQLKGETLHDSYLNIAFHFPDKLRRLALNIAPAKAGKEYGSGDASSVDDLKQRQALSKFKHTAEWGLGLSAGLQGLVKVKNDVLTTVEAGKHVAEATALLGQVNEEIIDFINRNIAAIPGPMAGNTRVLRADGTECPPYKPLEAYEVVPDNNGQPVKIPGAHTLPWHAAQLYDALHQVIAADKREQKLAA